MSSGPLHHWTRWKPPTSMGSQVTVLSKYITSLCLISSAIVTRDASIQGSLEAIFIMIHSNWYNSQRASLSEQFQIKSQHIKLSLKNATWHQMSFQRSNNPQKKSQMFMRILPVARSNRSTVEICQNFQFCTTGIFSTLNHWPTLWYTENHANWNIPSLCAFAICDILWWLCSKEELSQAVSWTF